MVPELIAATYITEYTIQFCFADGVVADVDLKDELWGEVFEPLKDVEVFKSFTFDKELNTVTWTSGADFAPEFLYERASAKASAAEDGVSRR
ncbi:MAG: DUF2442 domain-containing protein [Planctomycetaceae bacterium]